MPETYKMILVNSIASIILIIGIVIYRFIFPKKKINLLLLLLLISILPVISIFRPGDYESGDFNTHVYRTIQFYELLKEGHIMPSWAGILNATYGYPVFIFLNPLPYYLQSLFHLLGASFINSLKLLLALSYISSGIFFYLWAKKEIKSSLAAFSGAIVYLFTPYHFVDLHFRVALGETVFFSFLALFFYTFARFKEERNILWFIISSLALSCMMFSHQAMTVFSFFIIIPYFIYSAYSAKNRLKDLLSYLSIILTGFIYSVYSWFPHIVYPKYTLAYQLSDQTVVFPSLQELLYSPWRFGFLFQGHKGELSYLIGYTQIILLITGFSLLIRRKLSKKLMFPLSLWLGISLFLIFMMTPLSTTIWRGLPILNTAQFASRLMLILVFSLSVITIYVCFYLKKFSLFIWLFIIVTIGYTMLNWGHRRMIPQITDNYLLTSLPLSTSGPEGFCCMGQPKWSLSDKRWMDSIPKNHIEILKGKGEIKQISRTNTSHTYILYSQEKLMLKENTWYFPGWQLVIDGKPSGLSYTTKSKNTYPGLMQFSVTRGLHKVELTYHDLPDLFLAKVISAVTIISSLLFILMIFCRKIFRDYSHHIINLPLSHTRKKRKR